MNYSKFSFLLLFFVLLCCKYTIEDKLELEDIVFTILSQENLRHEDRALKLKNEIGRETNFSSVVYLSHLDLKHIGDWTVLPILPILWKKHKQKYSWVFFCTDETKVDTSRLKELLESLDPKDVFVGRGVSDKEPTIIHHFALMPDFKYPLISSGFAIHYNLIERLVKKIYEGDNVLMDFSIDASHELALYIKKNVDGIQLTHSPFFCIDHKKNCATYIRNSYICDKPPVDVEKIFFAVKTCNKFHKDRIPVVQKTWGQWTYHISFFSDAYDKNIPTVKLEVPNTEHGHCAKTQEIIKEIIKVMDNDENIEWAVISDDDTLFSTYRLQELLGCYNETDPIAIGERYGYNVFSHYGYNYITGGGGIILSRKAIEKFSDGSCQCPSSSTPDDMFLLGVCLHQLNITIVHIPLFHQARPNDYSEEYLLVGPPISFHKHWMINPSQVYTDWFQLSDLLLSKKNKHVEL